MESRGVLDIFGHYHDQGTTMTAWLQVHTGNMHTTRDSLGALELEQHPGPWRSSGLEMCSGNR